MEIVMSWSSAGITIDQLRPAQILVEGLTADPIFSRERRQVYAYQAFAAAKQDLHAYLAARAWTSTEGAPALLARTTAWLLEHKALLPGATKLAKLVAALRAKDTYLAAQHRRLAARRGAKRAAVAVAHSLLAMIYALLTQGHTSHELGSQYFNERDRHAVERRLAHLREALGYTVSFTPAPPA
jgi:uncharacterized protein DUF4158